MAFTPSAQPLGGGYRYCAQPATATRDLRRSCRHALSLHNLKRRKKAPDGPGGARAKQFGSWRPDLAYHTAQYEQHRDSQASQHFQVEQQRAALKQQVRAEPSLRAAACRAEARSPRTSDVASLNGAIQQSGGGAVVSGRPAAPTQSSMSLR